MQEDNWSKRLADSLRKQQEDSPLPYEPGAWEAFEKRRKAGGIPPVFYWISGIAASLAALFLIGNLWFSPSENPSSGLEKLADVAQEFSDTLSMDKGSIENTGEAHLSSEGNKSELFAENQLNQVASQPGKTKANQPVQSGLKQNLPVASAEQSDLQAKESLPILPEKPISGIGPIAEAEPTSDPQLEKPSPPTMTEEEAKARLLAQIGEEMKEEPTEEVTYSSLILGFGPGFGTRTQNNVATSGSSLALGVVYDLKVGDKLSLGSGLGLNYLNQSSQSQDYAQVAGFSSAVREYQQVQQVQVDIPLYVRYPITRDQAVSVQAGFSNLITFNQQAEQVVSFTRQVYVADAMNVSANASTLKTEQLAVSSDLNVPGQRFFPLATANLGVNIRVFESRKTSYLIMPFYNYPIQDISGTGENPGVVGAAFKINFGPIKK